MPVEIKGAAAVTLFADMQIAIGALAGNLTSGNEAIYWLSTMPAARGTIPFAEGLALSRLGIIPVSSWGAVATRGQLQIESSRLFSRIASVLPAFGLTAVGRRSIPLAWGYSPSRLGRIPAEWMGAFAVTLEGDFPLEILAVTEAFGSVAPSAWSSPKVTGSFQVEASRLFSRFSTVPAAWFGSLVGIVRGQFPVEIGLFVRARPPIPLGRSLQATRQGRMPVEIQSTAFTSTLRGNMPVAWERVSTFTGTRLPVEILRVMRRIGPRLPVEILESRRLLGRALPIERLSQPDGRRTWPLAYYGQTVSGGADIEIEWKFGSVTVSGFGRMPIAVWTSLGQFGTIYLDLPGRRAFIPGNKYVITARRARPCG